MSDLNSMLANGGIGSAFTVAMLVFARLLWLLRTVNHKRIRSFCCGKTCVASVDVEDTTPQAHQAHEAHEAREPPLPSIHVASNPETTAAI